jgi:hypothetical protein
MAKAKKTIKAKTKAKTKILAAKSAKKKSSKKPSQTQLVVAKLEALDKILLKLAPGPYTQVLKQIETGKRRIGEERKLALEIGARILEKAKEVRDSLITRTRTNNKS